MSTPANEIEMFADEIPTFEYLQSAEAERRVSEMTEPENPEQEQEELELGTLRRYESGPKYGAVSSGLSGADLLAVKRMFDESLSLHEEVMMERFVGEMTDITEAIRQHVVKTSSQMLQEIYKMSLSAAAAAPLAPDARAAAAIDHARAAGKVAVPKPERVNKYVKAAGPGAATPKSPGKAKSGPAQVFGDPDTGGSLAALLKKGELEREAAAATARAAGKA